jgi:hypothetical protein
VYGAICLVFVKFFMRLALWAVSTFAGISMNWGKAYGAGGEGGSTDVADKLDAIWQGPLLLGDSPFWGGFPKEELAHMSWLAQVLICIWIFVVVGFVAAFVVSFFYSASTLAYCLLRREVDATDLEDVYFEEQAPLEAEFGSTAEASEGQAESSDESPAPDDEPKP